MLTMKRAIKKIIEEELELAETKIWSRIERVFESENRNPSRSRLKLQFKNRKISPTVLTGEEIKDEGNACIEVNLVDESTGNVVDVGPEASASVELVLLKDGDDDCSMEEFKTSIVRETEGKKPPLTGNVRVKLQGGVGVVDNVKLRHYVSKIKPPVFRIGARVLGDFGSVKGSRTERFTVKDFRNKYYKKHETPSPSDEVSRLVNIRKGGSIDKRLRDANIFTVEDFLIRLLINPEELKSIAKMGDKNWDATVSNAQACLPDKRMYFNGNSEQKKGVVFNIFGQILGLHSENQYDSASVLSENQKVCAQRLLASACEDWEKVVPFDDMNSLRVYLDMLSTCRDSADSARYESMDGIGESGSRFLSFSHDLDGLSTCRDSVDSAGYESMGESSGPFIGFSVDTMFPGFDEYMRLKRWKKLYCVSRLFSVKKRVSLDCIRNCKKQRFG